MKWRMLSALAGAGSAMIVSSYAHGAFVGLSLQSSDVGTRTIHRLFANFNNPADSVYYWGTGLVLGYPLTSATQGAVVIQNLNSIGSGPGGGFLNAQPNGSNSLAPTSAPSPLDSYYTIGTDQQAYPQTGDVWLFNLGLPNLGTLQTPGTPNLTQVGNGGVVSTILSSSAGTGHQPNPAWFAGSLQDGHRNAVLLAQFAVAQGEFVIGTIGLAWLTEGNPQMSHLESNLVFNQIPGPGVPAIVGIAGIVGLAGSRRRRG